MLNLYLCRFTNNYLNMKTEICQCIIFTCFIQHALSKITTLPIHYLFNVRRWRLPFCLHLNLGITWLLQSARMTESPVFLNKETHSLKREKVIFLNTNSFFDHHLTLITQRITFKSKKQLLYNLGDLECSPINSEIAYSIKIN